MIDGISTISTSKHKNKIWQKRKYFQHLFSDIDECGTYNPSDQLCTDTPGSYTCACRAGFTMDANQKCQGKHSLYFTLKIYLCFDNNATFVKILSIDIKQYYCGFTVASFVDRGKWNAGRKSPSRFQKSLTILFYHHCHGYS